MSPTGRIVISAVLSLTLLSQMGVPTARAEVYMPPTVNSSALPNGGITEKTKKTVPCNSPATSDNIEKNKRQQQFRPLINARPVWSTTQGEGQTVAIIDTGINPHPRLKNLEGLADFNSDRGLNDCDQHGSLVAAILAAQPQEDGFAGVAPGVRILSIRQTSSHYGILKDPFEGRERRLPPGVRHPEPQLEGNPGNVITLAKAVRIAADAGATVINISQAACRPRGHSLGDEALGAAISYAVQVKDIVVVTAAGNLVDECRDQNEIMPLTTASIPQEKVKTIVSPAYFDNLVLTVGSVAQDGSPSDFSIAGPWVDVVAPGEGIVSLGPRGLVDAVQDDKGNRGDLQGTSFATPFVSGVVALVRAKHPDWSAQQVMDQIKETARPLSGGRNTQVGYGLVDPIAAVNSTPKARAAAGAGIPFRDYQEKQPSIIFGGILIGIVVVAAGGVLVWWVRRNRRLN
ncbi:MAG: type VII secretion-associated serine protease mycosin [Lawsonella sp.]